MAFRVEAPTRLSIFGGALGIILIGVLSGYLTYWWLSQRATSLYNPPPINMLAVFRENNRGVAYMEEFDYANAVRAFERVTDMAPDWQPGQINLGIALLNSDDEQNRSRAIELFQGIVDQEPNNPYAHFCLGKLLSYRGKLDEAISRFEAVTRIDPCDAHGWLELGISLDAQGPQADRRIDCFQRAYELDPYLGGAIYQLAQGLSLKDPARKEKLLKEFQDLTQAEWTNQSRIKYTEMGKYAEVIGRDPKQVTARQTGPVPLFLPGDHFQVHLAPGAKWAARTDLEKSPQGELLSAVRDRFGATMVELDYNGDGKPDLFLLAAVVENGQVRDLLLRNDGEGHFIDVTAEAGLAGARASLGCTVGDFDNDEFPDLFITGAGRQWLFRNNRKGKFEDVTAEAGLDKLTSVCLGSAFVDLDQDGDLDLLVAQYAASSEEALAALRGTLKGPSKGGLAVFLNVREVPAVSANVDPPPSQPKFRRLEKPAELLGPPGPTVSFAISDIDGDHDLDLLQLVDRQAPALILNDRLLRFHRVTMPEMLLPAGRWNGALVFDANHDGRSDLLVIGPGHRPVLLLVKPSRWDRDVRKSFELGATNSPPLLQAQAIDLDYDGWTDIVGLSDQHVPVWLQNDGEKLVHLPDGLGADNSWPKDLVAIRVGRFDLGKYQDLMVWSESKGLQLYVNKGNENSAVKLEITGHRRVDKAGEKCRSNSDGFGVWVTAEVKNFWTGLEYTTISAGLGQSRSPVVLGLAHHPQPDVLRLRWPDNVIQAELEVPACQLFRVHETNRKDISCPILFTWNGERFVFVTDFLGAGSMGELEPDGSTRPPRPEESVKIEAEQLVPRDGKYVLKIAEPMSEATYLDRLQLLVLDHPADVRVYPDERFISEELPSPLGREGRVRGDLLAFRDEIFPVKARDHRGRDVTKVLALWDRDTVNDFAQRSWLGYAEEHWVELDFSDRLAKFGPTDKLILCLAGWTDYPYPESIWAATQAGVPLLPPTLERLDFDSASANSSEGLRFAPGERSESRHTAGAKRQPSIETRGKWQTLIADAGFPAGLPRMMTLDVTDKLTGPRCVIRLRSNMEVYWDQIFVAPLLSAPIRAGSVSNRTESGIVRVSVQEVDRAILSARGLMQEFSPDGKLPTIYDYDRLQSNPVSRLAGMMTRFGDVTELLRDRDDRFVIFGPGDDLRVEFDAKNLPDLPAGWKRSFVLKTWGYCKDCSLFTATGDTIEPLPFHQMSKYPYGPEEHYPDDPPHQDYLRRYQTRRMGGSTNQPSR